MGRAQAVVRKDDCHYMNILVLINCDILLRGNVWAGVLGKTTLILNNWTLCIHQDDEKVLTLKIESSFWSQS